MQEELEIALIKYNKKTWSKSALLGFFIGLAVIVPGISGSTVAIIFKLYDQFLYAVGNLFKKFKQCFAFLLPIGIGMVVGIVLGFFTVKQLLEILPFAIVCLFAGLMVGAFPAVKDEIGGAERTPKRVVLFVAFIGRDRGRRDDERICKRTMVALPCRGAHRRGGGDHTDRAGA